MSDAGKSKKVFLKTFGCQMNAYDSERMSEALAADGYQEAASIDDADLVILNTCHIRERAAEKVYSELGKIRDVKLERQAAGRDTIITVAGCVAQAEGEEIVRRQPAVDLVLGPQSTHRLTDLVKRLGASDTLFPRAPIVETAFPEEDKFANLPERPAGKRVSLGGNPNGQRGALAAFVTVQEGCDKFCTFCVVPYTRGAEFSRPLADVEHEARRLTERGIREITLLGQNVNGYHGKDREGRETSLADLIRHLARVDGLERLRYMTSHPRDMTDDLIDVHASERKLMPYLHLPVQSGADRILAAMNRKHTADDYISLVERIRKARPDMALSTDLIVGFPGETEAEFEATLDLVRSVQFASAFSFKYSPRPGTPAATMGDQVPEDVKTYRLKRLQDVLVGLTNSFNASCVGKVFPVLLEKPGRYAGQLIGRSPYLQSVHVHADASALGRILPVEIASVGPNSLAGVVRAA